MRATTYAGSRLPRLVTTAFICWMVGGNTHVIAANTLPAIHLPSQAQMHAQQNPVAANDVANNVQVLSPKDAELYRAAFSAQDKGDWQTADNAIAELDDKSLLGHVLADRYERRGASAAELHDWLVNYGSLPEAGAIYSKAQHLKPVKGVTFPKPSTADMWAGGGRYGMSFGFKAETNDKQSQAARAFSAKIDRTLHKTDPLVVKAMLDTEQKKRALSPSELADANSRIANGLFYEGQVNGARKFSAEAIKNKNPLGLWINGLASWKQNDMPQASQSFIRLANVQGLSSWDRAAADFWAYRSLKRAGDTKGARTYLEAAAKQPRSFYGFLAAQLLGRDIDWSWDVPELNSENVNLLAGQKAGWRALALVQIGKNDLAEAELRRLNPQGHRDMQAAMLALAEKAHMASLAMQLGGLATNDNGKYYDAALYPIPSWQPDEGFQVDRALVYALMRRESQFDPRAVSNQGACGLMQIMPATANLISDDDIGHGCSARLMNPSFNMALGQKYVRRLADEPNIGDNLLLLLAAYNCGPGKMARWAEEANNDPLLFIESMPVRETRDYVQHVLIHYWTYRARLNQPETSLAQLAHGEWPRLAMNDTNVKPIRRADADMRSTSGAEKRRGFIQASYTVGSR